ncbi:MAG: elongation factor P [Bacilli bacterium]|nr:elongation factor P [Bacilli bacterium]
MVSSNNFKTGMTIEYKGDIFQILEFQHVKPGKGAAFVRSRLKNLRTGAIIDYTFKSDERMATAQIDKKDMQYSYSSGEYLVFMDTETWEQLEIPQERMTNELYYIKEGDKVTIIMFQHEILGIQLPDKVTLEVIQTPPGVRGDTAANATKEATLETGLVIQVPLFVNEGDKVIVSTVDGKYSSRA